MQVGMKFVQPLQQLEMEASLEAVEITYILMIFYAKPVILSEISLTTTTLQLIPIPVRKGAVLAAWRVLGTLPLNPTKKISGRWIKRQACTTFAKPSYSICTTSLVVSE